MFNIKQLYDKGIKKDLAVQDKKWNIIASETEKVNRPTLKIDLAGSDGNIFFVLAKAGKLVDSDKKKEMKDKILKAKNYKEALNIINEYVEIQDVSGIFTGGQINTSDLKNKPIINSKSIKLIFKNENFDYLKKILIEIADKDFERVFNKNTILKELNDTTDIKGLVSWIKDYYETEQDFDETSEFDKQESTEITKEDIEKRSDYIDKKIKEKRDAKQTQEALESVEEAIDAINNSEKDNIEANLIKLYDYYIDNYIKASGETLDKVSGEVSESKFYASKQFEEFKLRALGILANALINEKINDSDMDVLMDVYNIRVTTDELNRILAERKPKPSSNPPPGKKWAWDAEVQDWVLVNA